VRAPQADTGQSRRLWSWPQPADNRDMEAKLLIKQADIAALCRRFGVTRLEVFGSASSGDFDPASSDYDFIASFAAQPAVSMARRFLGFSDALEALLERKVDLMSDRPIANPYLRAAVNASRKTVYAESASEALV
jgi:uncharacterized protein